MPDLVGGRCGRFGGSGRSSLLSVEAGPPHRGAREGMSHPPQVNPILRTGRGQKAWRPMGAEAARGWALSPSRQPRVGCGLQSSPSAAGERKAEPFPQDQRATCSPHPSYPRILFLLSHRRRRAIPFRGRPRVEPRRPWHPPNPGREGGDGGQRPSWPVPPPPVSLTQRPSRPPFWERGEKKKEAVAGGGENGREGTGAATSSGSRAQPAAAWAR